MKKTLLFCAITLLAFSAKANIQNDISGKYSGNLIATVTITGEPEEISINTNVYIIKQTDEKYTIQLDDIVIPEITTLSDLKIVDTERNDLAGVAILSRKGAIPGPSVEAMGIQIATSIYLNDAKIGEGQLILTARINGKASIFPKEMEVATIAFNGTIGTTGISNTIDNTLSIYFSNDVITLEGFDSDNYAIYSLNGSVIQTGKVQNGKIETNSIPAGAYILNVNNKTTKFIK